MQLSDPPFAAVALGGKTPIRLMAKKELFRKKIFAWLIAALGAFPIEDVYKRQALEVLTIIAYRQPVTRAFIDQLRGVDSSNTVSSLAEKGLIEEAGRLDVPGKPMLFRTTEQFLRSFSLASIEDLPALPALEENEQMELNMDGTLHETPPGEQLRFLNGEPVPPETE